MRDVGFNAFAVGRVIPYYVALSASALCLGVSRSNTRNGTKKMPPLPRRKITHPQRPKKKHFEQEI